MKAEDFSAGVAITLRLSTPTPSSTYINITNAGNVNIAGPTTITDN
jgi:Ethanolamine utilization protein EutJ (predicted chaperonin)